MIDRTETNPHVTNFILKRNENFPNSTLPVLIYRGALNLPDQKRKAAGIVQKIFNRNNWSNAWTNGIYDFHHYHSNTHECMAVIAGSANLVIGGPNGKRVKVVKSDVIILPAGTAHRCTKHSDDFTVVGAYPDGRQYDTNTGTTEELQIALPKIHDLELPDKDPLFGEEGFLHGYWKKTRKK